MAEMDITTLKQRHDDTQRDYRGFEAKLLTALTPHKPAPHTMDRILGSVEQFGVDGALRRITKEPLHFGVSLPSDAARTLAPLLHSLADTNQRMDSLLAEREKKLREMNPAQLPLFQIAGREFEIDVKNGTITYLDAPAKPERLDMKVFHTKDQPDPERLPARSKQRNGNANAKPLSPTRIT